MFSWVSIHKTTFNIPFYYALWSVTGASSFFLNKLIEPMKVLVKSLFAKNTHTFFLTKFVHLVSCYISIKQSTFLFLLKKKNSTTFIKWVVGWSKRVSDLLRLQSVVNQMRWLLEFKLRFCSGYTFFYFKVRESG